MRYRLLSLLIIFSVISLCTKADNIETNDTVVIITNARDVKITNGDGKISVAIGETSDGRVYKYSAQAVPNDSLSDWDLNLPFLDRKRNKVQSNLVYNAYFGYCFYNGSFNGVNLRANFYELFLNPTLSTSFGIGAGINFNDMSLAKDNILSKEGEMLNISTAPNGAKKVNSILHTFGFSVPVHLYQQLGNGWHIGLGSTLCLNTYASAMSEWRLDELRYKFKYKGLHQRIMTFDFDFSINYKNLGIYVGYSPMSMMKTGYGPDFKHWTAGIHLSL